MAHERWETVQYVSRVSVSVIVFRGGDSFHIQKKYWWVVGGNNDGWNVL